ncbi:hypothetical protein [Thioclava indica]|uniref:Uncharacterized protein n=1 Tax=Thioclava indica TaxID=1353528 RepID=A0A074JUE6_9RHOB|nr:hypothetical protein [Thioclava indica]KEO60074.1 hypothetical protein DT23_14380 [Thioclava indica]
MKRIVATSAVLALFAGAAFAAGPQTNERPGAPPTAVVSEHKVQVKAGDLYFNKERVRMGLEAGDLVDVTHFPETGLVDPPSREG